MRSQHEFLAELVDLLRATGREHMIVGSVAASLHGRPRATQDIDVVVQADDADVTELVRLCEARGFYADLADARDAVRFHSLFSVIGQRTCAGGLKSSA